MLCSGGGRFPILDQGGLAWPVTSVGSSVTFNWFCTACHVTMNWQYFVDGQLKATYNGNGQPGVNTSHTVSGLPSGRHTILGRWNIGDTPAAFYSCVDVNVGGGGSTARPRRRGHATATAPRRPRRPPLRRRRPRLALARRPRPPRAEPAARASRRSELHGLLVRRRGELQRLQVPQHRAHPVHTRLPAELALQPQQRQLVGERRRLLTAADGRFVEGLPLAGQAHFQVRGLAEREGMMRRVLFAAALASSVAVSTAGATTLPAGFTETLVATGLATPTAMEFAPDGRLFVAEQGGRCAGHQGRRCCWRRRSSRSPSTPRGERGLLGIAFDPDFATNHFVYVYYTATTPGDPQPRQPLHRRTATSPSPAARSCSSTSTNLTQRDQPQRRRDPLRRRRQALRRRRRERQRRELRSRSRTCSARSSASTPTARSPPTTRSSHRPPAPTAPSGRCGLRNPFTFAFQPGTGPDVHQRRRRERRGRRSTTASPGANYGWPDDRRPDDDPSFTRPLYAYGHGAGRTTAAPSPAAPSTTRHGANFPGTLRRRLLLRRLLRRLDPHDRPANARRSDVRDRPRQLRRWST